MNGQPGEYWGILVVASLVALYVFSWFSVAGLPRAARILARLVLAVLILAPLALYATKMAREGGPRPSREQSAPPPMSAAPSPPVAAPQPPAPPPPAAAPAPTAEAPPPPPAEGAPPVVVAEPPAMAAEEEESAGASRGLTPSEEASAPGAGAPPPAPVPEPRSAAEPPVADDKKEETFTVVPVFYGTDRAAITTPVRLDYTADRGRRLELGRALVTIPKAHEAPGIERPWSFRIPVIDVVVGESEDPEKHFTMKEVRALSEAEFLALVAERLAAAKVYRERAFVFVHGFNTSFDYAIFRAAQITNDLGFDGVPFAYSWPSRGGVSSYTYDRESSGQAQRYLKDFLQLVVDKSGAKEISVIAHSMGNQPTMQVLKDLKAARPSGAVLSQIILAAPDVDRDNFEDIAREIQGLASGITLYAAANDRALSVSKSFNGGVPRAGDVPDGTPLVLPGVDTVDVTAASTDSLGLNHSGYAENNDLLSDMAALIRTGQRPPKLRYPGLEEIMTDKGPFWRFKAK